MSRKNVNRMIIITLLVPMFISSIVEAGSKRRRGTAGAQELLIPMGSRGTAMSGAFVAGISGIEAAEWNVAGIAGMSGTGEAMFTHSSWIADIDITYAAIASNFGGKNMFGLSLKSLDFGDIDVTTADLPDGTGETYSPNFITLGFLYSRQMTDRILFGADIKIINESIMRESATGFALDAGVQYKTSPNGIKIGASIRNLGLNMIFNGPDLEEFHQPEDTEPGTNTEPRRISLSAFELPTTLELGVAYGPLDLGAAKAVFCASFLNNNFSLDEYRFGAEINVMDMFYTRAGLALAFDPEPFGADFIEGTEDDTGDDQWESSSEDFIWGPTFGFGLNLSRLTGLGLSVDYAYRTAEYFDGVSWLTLKVTF